MMAYVAEQIQDFAVELFKKNQLNFCRLNQERTIYIQHLAAMPGKAHLAVRLLTRQQNMMGYQGEQLLIAHECNTIEKYYMQRTTECYSSILVQYKLFDKNHTSYLIPSTMDLIITDGTIPSKRPTKTFIFAKDCETLYTWNRSSLSLETGVNYLHAQFMEQASNISYLQLMASRLYDHTLDNYETLTEISSATKMMTTFVTTMHLSTVGMDPKIIILSAKISVQTIKAVVHNVIDTAFPIVIRVQKFVMIIIIIMVSLMVIWGGYKLWTSCKERNINERTAQTLQSINQSSETPKLVRVPITTKHT